MTTEKGDRGNRRPTQRTPQPPSNKVCATCKHYATDLKPEHQEDGFTGHCLQLASHNNIPMPEHAASQDAVKKRTKRGMETTARDLIPLQENVNKQLKAKMRSERTGWGAVLVKPDFGCTMWEDDKL